MSRGTMFNRGSKFIRATAGISALLLIQPASPALAGPISDIDRAELDQLVDRAAPEMESSALKIWNWAEPGFIEDRSSGLLQSLLKKDDFTVTSGVAGMPTAFVASFRNGDGPVIGFTAEFDALPGISQTADKTSPSPIPEANAGHACGHNLVGVGAVGAARALKAWMIAHKVRGEIRVFGSPAEEAGNGKSFMVRDGLFKDVDIVLHWHPFDRTAFFNTTMMANVEADVTFKGVSSHAAVSPERGRSAVAGLEVMDMAVNSMRQFVPEGTRIHSIIVEGGRAANVVPNTAKSFYMIRHPRIDVLKELNTRVEKAALGAAIATETTVEYKTVNGSYPVLVNDTLLDTLYGNAKPVVAKLAWTPKQIAYARAMQASFGKGKDQEPLPINVMTPPGVHDTAAAGSTDVGDISYVVPTAGILLLAWVPGSSGHSWQSDASSGSAIGITGMVAAAKILSATGAELLQSPDLISAAKLEFDAKRGSDFRYVPLMGDSPPPLDYQKRVLSKPR